MLLLVFQIFLYTPRSSSFFFVISLVPFYTTSSSSSFPFILSAQCVLSTLTAFFHILSVIPYSHSFFSFLHFSAPYRIFLIFFRSIAIIFHFSVPMPYPFHFFDPPPCLSSRSVIRAASSSKMCVRLRVSVGNVSDARKPLINVVSELHSFVKLLIP